MLMKTILLFRIPSCFRRCYQKGVKNHHLLVKAKQEYIFSTIHNKRSEYLTRSQMNLSSTIIQDHIVMHSSQIKQWIIAGIYVTPCYKTKLQCPFQIVKYKNSHFMASGSAKPA